jgi:hypothetical protein
VDSLHAVIYADVDLAEDVVQLPRALPLRLHTVYNHRDNVEIESLCNVCTCAVMYRMSDCAMQLLTGTVQKYLLV